MGASSASSWSCDSGVAGCEGYGIASAGGGPCASTPAGTNTKIAKTRANSFCRLTIMGPRSARQSRVLVIKTPVSPARLATSCNRNLAQRRFGKRLVDHCSAEARLAAINNQILAGRGSPLRGGKSRTPALGTHWLDSTGYIGHPITGLRRQGLTCGRRLAGDPVKRTGLDGA